MVTLRSTIPTPGSTASLLYHLRSRDSVGQSLALQLVLLDLEGILQQSLLFFEMSGFQTSGHRRRRIASCVHHVASVVVLSLVQECLNTWLDEAPGASIQGFFLTPNDGLGVLVCVQVLLKERPWEGVELLDTGDGRVLDALLATVLVQSGVHLAGAQDDSFNLVRLTDRLAVFWIRNDPLEVRIARKVLNIRSSEGVTEERLRKEDNQCCGAS